MRVDSSNSKQILPMVHHKDEDILSLISQTETRNRGLTLLTEKYKERIYWHIRRLVVSHEDAQDVMQETFTNVCKYIDRFREGSKLYTWLYRIATNECIRLFRKSRKIFTPLDSVQSDLIDKLHYETAYDSHSIEVKFQEAILRLPNKQRLVFNLRYYDEMSFQEIGDILGISENSSKTNYHYASEKIKSYMLNL